MLEVASTVVEFLLVTVLFKAIIVRWFADILMKLIKKFFIKTKREITIWNHYHNRALKNGHAHKHVTNCSDGECALL